MANNGYRAVCYQGKFLGRYHGSITPFKSRRFEPALTESETLDLLCELDPEVLVHLRKKAPGVYLLALFYHLQPKDYLDTSTLILSVVHSHFRNRHDLHDRDYVLWELVHGQRLEDKIFPELQPA